MLDHSNQSVSSNGLSHSAFEYSGLNLSPSTLSNSQHGSVLPVVLPSEQLPAFADQQIRRANLNLNDVFPGDRSAQTHDIQAHTGKEFHNKHLSSNSDSLTGTTSHANLPLVGIIDTGFSATDAHITHSAPQLGRDRIEGDDNPLTTTGDQHGTHILNAIAARDDHAPLWLGRAVGSGKWAESLVEFANSAKNSGQAHAVVNLSFDLTQVNPDGSVSTRQQLTPQERDALSYARQKGILIVAAAGNTGREMSALGQASQEFDNIITVGAAHGLDRADYSSYGSGLTLIANGSNENGKNNLEGTSIATAKVTGTVSQVWAANPNLGYRQVIEILKATATDLKTPGQDHETGAGLLNQTKALRLAAFTTPAPDRAAAESPILIDHLADSQTTHGTTLERSAFWGISIPIVSNVVDAAVGVVGDVGHTAVNTATAVGSGIASVAQDAAHGAVNTVTAVGSGIASIGSDVINGTTDVIHDATSGALQAVTEVAHGVIRGATAIATGHPLDAVGTLVNTAVGLGENVIHGATQVVGTGIEAAGNLAGDGIHTAGTVAGTVAAGAGSLAGEAIHAAGNVTGTIVSTVSPSTGAAVKIAGDTAASGVNSVGNGIGAAIQQETQSAEKIVTEKIAGILQREVYQVQAFPDRLKQLGKDLTKNPTKGFGKWIGQVGIDLAETLGIPETAETIADIIKPETRSLTAREIKLAKSVFGNSINYRLVRLDEAAKTVDWVKQIKGFNAPRPFTTFHTINSWGTLEDKTLIHELTHVWQYEHGGAKYIPEALAVNGKSSGYDYKGVSNLRKLQAAGKKMSSFDPEKQAMIVEEYFMIKTGHASETKYSGGATLKDMPTYAHFVKEVSTLPEKTLD